MNKPKRFAINFTEVKRRKDKAIPVKANNGYPVLPPYKGQWFPVSVAAYLYECSRQTINLLIASGRVRSVKYPGSPALVSMDDLRTLQPYGINADLAK